MVARGDYRLLIGDCREMLRTLPEKSVHCCVSSPPYFALRDYGVDGQIGLEPTPEVYIDALVQVYREVWRVLRDDGCCWVNLGDSYNAYNGNRGIGGSTLEGRTNCGLPEIPSGAGLTSSNLKSGDLMNIPHRVAAALQADGWYWRSTIVWHKRSPMPESVSGWRWVRCRVTVGGGERGREAWRNGASGDNPQQDHDGRGFAPSATWKACPGCDKCRETDGYVLRRGRWRPTNAHEYIFLMTKGELRRNAIQFSDLSPDIVHFSHDFGAKDSSLETSRLCVGLATAFFYAAQEQSEFRLPPFYSEEWQQRLQDDSRDLVSSLPPIHRLAANAACLLNSNMTTKDFLQQVHCLWTDLREADHLLIGRGLAKSLLPPSRLINMNTAIAINYAGKVCEVDFSHAQIIEQTVGPTTYFCDGDAVQEPTTGGAHHRGEGLNPKAREGVIGREKQNGSFSTACNRLVETRNPRNVWTLSSEPFKGNHFATFPSEIPRRAILASTSAGGCCADCGAQYAPVVDSERVPTRPGISNQIDPTGMPNRDPQRHVAVSKVSGYRPTCKCNAGVARCVVLDHFAGSGTTGQVAVHLGRDFIGCELNPEYAAIAEQRINTPWQPKGEKKPKKVRRSPKEVSKPLFV